MHAQLQGQRLQRRADFIEDLLNGHVESREGLKHALKRIEQLRKA